MDNLLGLTFCACLYVTQRAFCAYCNDRIWGLGRQGFKCTQCKLLVHKKCHKLVRILCSNDANATLQSTSSTASSHQGQHSAESSMFIEDSSNNSGHQSGHAAATTGAHHLHHHRHHSQERPHQWSISGRQNGDSSAEKRGMTTTSSTFIYF